MTISRSRTSRLRAIQYAEMPHTSLYPGNRAAAAASMSARSRPLATWARPTWASSLGTQRRFTILRFALSMRTCLRRGQPTLIFASGTSLLTMAKTSSMERRTARSSSRATGRRSRNFNGTRQPTRLWQAHPSIRRSKCGTSRNRLRHSTLQASARSRGRCPGTTMDP